MVGKDKGSAPRRTLPAFRITHTPPIPAAMAPTNSKDHNGPDMKEVMVLMQGIQQLRHLGVEEHVLPLPKICVVGDQSTGKSSLIEGMSGIKVPRGNGTCTRCPLEINLSPGSKWIYNIYLYKKYMYDVHSTRGGATAKRPLGPWSPQQHEDMHFATIEDKSEVAEALEWAQIAVLNPGKSHEVYKASSNCNPGRGLQVKFSPNVVRLDISGPELPILSFYDLPGVINQVESDSEKYLVTLVRNLVKEYISADNCINLLALPMINDLENSTAASIIKEKGAQNRTVGVLTKPDCVLHNDHKPWFSILSGHKFRLGHGYFIIKNNPDPAVDNSIARKEEVDFFLKNEPYSTELAAFHDRYGTANLEKFLSEKLAHSIATCLPAFRSQVLHKIASVDESLAKLPKPSEGNPPMEIFQKILELSRELQLNIDGSGPEYPFQTQWKEQTIQFRKQLSDSRPRLIVPPPPKLQGTANSSISIDLSMSSDEEQPEPTPTKRGSTSHGKRNIIGTQSEKSPAKRFKSGVAPDEAKEDSEEPVEEQPPITVGASFKLEQIRQIRNDGYIGLASSLDPRVVERMSILAIDHWQDLMVTYLNNMQILADNLVADCIKRAFGQWEQKARIYPEVREIAADFMAKIQKEQFEVAKLLLVAERYKPMTFDDERVNAASKIALEMFEASRRPHLALEALKASSGGKHIDITPMKLDKVPQQQLPTDPFKEEIALMATVRGYYALAASRFTDYMSATIQSQLFVKLRENLADALSKGIGITDPDAHQRCTLLLAIDPKIEEKRMELKSKRGTLATALEWLEKEGKSAVRGEEEGMVRDGEEDEVSFV